MTTDCTCEEFKNVDINAWRNGYKWTINECLRLEREYDLLKLTVPVMAILHNRTINAIMCKLQDDGLDTYNNLYIQTYGQDYIDEQINQLNNLYSIDDEDEEDYVPDIQDHHDDDDDGSNHAYIYEQVKRMHNHISNFWGYFTNKKTNTSISATAE